MKLRFVVSHPFRKEREMDGAPGICSLFPDPYSLPLAVRPSFSGPTFQLAWGCIPGIMKIRQLAVRCVFMRPVSAKDSSLE